MIFARHFLLLAGCVLLPACDHSAPFEPAPVGTTVPFDATPPARLTYNMGDDRTASWLPDGSGILYSSERLDSPDHDRCIRELPPTGGSVVRSVCEERPGYPDSTDVFESPAVSSDGHLLFLKAVSSIGLQKGPNKYLMLGTWNDPSSAKVITRIPYFASSGVTHSHVAFVNWVAPDRFAYVGQQLWYQGSTFYPDTFASGLEIVRGQLQGDSATLTVVPNTTYASALGAFGSGDSVVATFGGDSQVYKVDLATGGRTPIWDFGAAGIARDPQLVGNTLVAIVGRSVLYELEDPWGNVQRDEGGDIHIVDLSSGTDRVISYEDTLFRRPALSPDGHLLVVEASPFAPVHIGPDSDYNAQNHRPDLWMVTIP